MNQKYELFLRLAHQTLDTASRLIDKAEAFVAEKGIHEHELIQASLAPDMFNFTRQIQLISDNAKGYTARLSGKEVVFMQDTESSIVELKERIAKTKALVSTFSVDNFADADNAKISFAWMAGKHFKGNEFVEKFAVANMFFHLSMAYAILRNQGVQIGKMDFIGQVPMYDNN
jgi:hypothetical protein